MRTAPEVIVYETKPATEWLFGGPVQKMNPRFAHSVMQGEISTRLRQWARGRGRVGPEWRFWVQPPGEESRYLVLDIGYLSHARLPQEARDEAEEPHLAPDVAVEIVSPSERAKNIEHKIDVYLRAGTLLVVIIDPVARTMRTVDSSGDAVLPDGAVFTHSALRTSLWTWRSYSQNSIGKRFPARTINDLEEFSASPCHPGR